MLVAATVFASATAFAATSYDKEAADLALARAARQTKENCGQAKSDVGEAKGPWGKTDIHVTIGRNGHTKNVVIDAPFTDTPTGKCAVRAFSNLVIPPWNGADVTLDQPIEIPRPAPSSDAKAKQR